MIYDAIPSLDKATGTWTLVDPLAGTGSPEGKITAPVGSIYTDTAATNGAIRWIKTSSTGNTGWEVEWPPEVVPRAEVAASEAADAAVRAESAAVTAEAGATTATGHATQTADDRRQTGEDRAHVDSQVEAVDTAFTESIPPYLQPDAPGGLKSTYVPQVGAAGVTTIYVSPDGTGDGTAPETPTTIQGAFDKAQSSGILTGRWRILLAEGTYTEANLSLDQVASTRKIEILGPEANGGAPTAIFDGGSLPGNNFGFILSGVQAYIQDVAFVNYSPGTAIGTGLQVQDGSDVWTVNVHVNNCSFIGIYAKGLCNLRVTGGVVSNCERGIRAYGNSSYVVGYGSASQRVQINNCHYGVEVRDMAAGHIDYADIDACDIGIWAYQGCRVTPQHCTITNCSQAGLQVSAGAWWYDAPDAPTTFSGNARDVSTGAASSETSWSQFPSEVVASVRDVPSTLTGVTSGPITDLSTIPVKWMRESGHQLVFHVAGRFTGAGDKTVRGRINLTNIFTFESSARSLQYFTITARIVAVTPTTQRVMVSAHEDKGLKSLVWTYDTAVNFGPSRDLVVSDIFGSLSDPAGGITINHAQYSYLPASHMWG